MLSVPEKYHYTTIKCPECGGQMEAVSTETMRVTRQFIEELEDADAEVSEGSPGVTTLRRVAALQGAAEDDE
tara:strand:- start:827 stop:1042 length:216 start_codon:yes stop_codon:yes gene_type:complete